MMQQPPNLQVVYEHRELNESRMRCHHTKSQLNKQSAFTRRRRGEHTLASASSSADLIWKVAHSLVCSPTTLPAAAAGECSVTSCLSKAIRRSDEATGTARGHTVCSELYLGQFKRLLDGLREKNATSASIRRLRRPFRRQSFLSDGDKSRRHRTSTARIHDHLDSN